MHYIEIRAEKLVWNIGKALEKENEPIAYSHICFFSRQLKIWGT